MHVCEPYEGQSSGRFTGKRPIALAVAGDGALEPRHCRYSGSTLAVGAVGEASAATGNGGNQADNSTPTVGAAYVFR